MHDVQRVEHRKGRSKHRRNNGEVLRNVIGDRKRRQGPAGHQQLLADLDNLDQLRRIGVEIDHVARLLRRLRARVHRDAHIGLRQRGGVVGAIAGHRDQLALALLAADQVHLVLRLRLRQEVVDARLARNRRRRQRIVAGDHDGSDAHRTKLRKPLLHPTLHHVLQVNHTQRLPVLRHNQRGAATPRHRLHRSPNFIWKNTTIFLQETSNGVRSALPNHATIEIHAGHSRHRAERHKLCLHLAQFASAKTIHLLGQHNDASSFRSLVWKRRKLRRIGKLILADARSRKELRSLTIAKRNRSRLIEEQRIHVAGRFDSTTRHRQHIVLHQTIHSCNPDRRKQSANRRRDQANQQRDQHEHRLRRGRVDRNRLQRHHSKEEDNRQSGQQDVQRNLVRRLLPLRALDQRNHAVQKGLARIRRNANLDLVRQHLRSAGNRRPIAAGLANHRRGLTCNRRLVNRSNAVDHLAIARNHVAGNHQDNISRAQIRTRDVFDASVHAKPNRCRLGLRAPQRIGLRFTAALRHRLGEVREQYSEPKPQRNLQVEAQSAVMRQNIPQQINACNDTADLDHKHDRVLHHRARTELDDRVHQCATNDLSVPKGAFTSVCHVFVCLLC